jgi:autotransporter translocation and assembly factor TamB
VTADATDGRQIAAAGRARSVRLQLRRRARSGCWRSCAIFLGAFLVLLVVFWGLLNRYLGNIAGNLVRQQLAAAINGRVEFERMQIGVGGGAILANARLYLAGTDDPVITAPKITARVNVLSFLGPNRGRRALKLIIERPQIELVREANGTFNLGRLAKTTEQKKRGIAMSLAVSNGSLHFRDYSLLRGARPDLRDATGVAANILQELGYEYEPPQTTTFHEETAVLNGSGSYNGERQETTFDVTAIRAEGGGVLHAKGSIQADGKQFDITTELSNAAANTLTAYLKDLVPQLDIVADATGSTSPTVLAGTVRQFDLRLIQKPNQKLTYRLTSEGRNLLVRTKTVGEILLAATKLSFDSAKDNGSVALDGSAFGTTLRGKLAIAGPERNLNGQIRAAIDDPAVSLALFGRPDVPLQGRISAEASVGGTASMPHISAALSSDALVYDKQQLGRLTGNVELADSILTVNELRLEGKLLRLSADGELGLKTNTGKVNVLATGVDLVMLQALLGQRPGAKSKEERWKGLVSAKGEVTLDAGKARTNFRAWGKNLKLVADLKSADVAGTYSGNDLLLKSAAVTALGPVLETPLLTSTGPVAVRALATGKISGLGSKSATLQLQGKAETTNAKPGQVRGNFTVKGPLASPKIQSDGTITLPDDKATYRLAAQLRPGMAPLDLTVNLTGAGLRFQGKADFAKQLLDGKLTAMTVELSQLVNANVTGRITASATVKGKFSAPQISGTVESAGVTYRADGRTIAAQDIAADFTLVGMDQLSIKRGSLSFMGNALHVSGSLGQKTGDLVLASDSFDLLALSRLMVAGSAEQQAVAQPSVRARGPLVVRITGSLKHPHAEINYRSSAGSIEGQSFASAELNASVDKSQAKINKLVIRGTDGGSIQGNGSVQFKPLRYSANATVTDFNVGLLGPLLSGTAVADLRGKIDGKFTMASTPNGLSASGDLQLIDGNYKGYRIDTAEAHFAAGKEGLELTSAIVRSSNTTLTASGVIPKDLSKAHFNISAPELELTLLQPLLPKGFPKPAGAVRVSVDLRPGARGASLPQAEISIANTETGISFSNRRLDSLTANLKIENDILTIGQFSIRVGSNSLNVTGQANLKEIHEHRHHSGHLPLDFTLNADNFQLADITPFFPLEQRSKVPVGVVSAPALHLGGTWQDPHLSGAVSFAFTKLPAGLPQGISTVAGSIEIRDNAFTIGNFDVGTQGADGDALNQAEITGSGEFALNPPRLLAGAINIDLSPAENGGRYLALNQSGLMDGGDSEGAGRSGSFEGTVGGAVTLTAPRAGEDAPAVVSGELFITQPETQTVLILPTPHPGGAPSPSKLRFDNLVIHVQPGTEVRYKPMVDLRAQITGDLTLNGVPGLPPGYSDGLRIAGQVVLTTGSMTLYRHTIRLDESMQASLRFRGEPGDLIPAITARGVLVLPNALRGTGDVITTGGIGATARRGSQDLTIYVTLNNLKLSAGEVSTGDLFGDPSQTPAISLTSEPPLGEDQIMRYLIGGVGDLLTGQGDFADVAGSELVGFGSSWISRQLEEALGVDVFSIGGNPLDTDNPFYVNVEKELSPQLSISYYKNFFSSTNQQEEYGLKYRPFRGEADNNMQDLQIEVNFLRDELLGSGSEFMFTWQRRF